MGKNYVKGQLSISSRDKVYTFSLPRSDLPSLLPSFTQISCFYSSRISLKSPKYKGFALFPSSKKTTLKWILIPILRSFFTLDSITHTALVLPFGNAVVWFGTIFLFKLDFSNYILCLTELLISIFCIIILKILYILYRFRSFCKHFAITLYITVQYSYYYQAYLVTYLFPPVAYLSFSHIFEVQSNQIYIALS